MTLQMPLDQLLRGFDEALHLIASLQEIHDAEAKESKNVLPSPRTKKDLWVSPTPRGLNPRLLDPFTFFQVFSREEWENRQNWYGVPIRFGCP